jgi:integrase/recombinase XerD
MSREEVKALLEAPRNLRHRALLTTMYAAGPRVSEVARLKTGDIDSARHVLWIRGGKGRKDRQTRLRLRLLELLRSYWRLETPRQWLFPGSQPDQPISVKSIFLACRSAARKAHITKPFTRSEVASLSDLQTRPDASVARHLMMIGTCRRCPRRTHLRSSERQEILAFCATSACRKPHPPSIPPPSADHP